jgi:peptidoglycan/LPS O-acetylase OafA/YrhL
MHMETSKNKIIERVPSLDGLRAFSVLLVIGGHFLYAHPELDKSSLLAIILEGSLGVRFFFVISGFLITTLLMRELDTYGSISLKNFYARRIIRLLPVYYLFIIFLFFMTIFTPMRLYDCNFLTAITFTKNYACRAWVDGHLWSLAVEQQFYLIWPPVFVLLGAKRVWIFAAFFILLAPISRAIEYKIGSRLYAWLPSNADVLMIGCLLAVYGGKYRQKLEKIFHWRPIATKILIVFLLYFPVYLSKNLLLGAFNVMFGPMIQGISAALLIVCLTYKRDGLLFTILNNRHVLYVGAISYSLYIWQMPFLARKNSYRNEEMWFLETPINLILILVLSVISFHFFEKPFMKLRHRLHFR